MECLTEKHSIGPAFINKVSPDDIFSYYENDVTRYDIFALHTNKTIQCIILIEKKSDGYKQAMVSTPESWCRETGKVDYISSMLNNTITISCKFDECVHLNYNTEAEGYVFTDIEQSKLINIAIEFAIKQIYYGYGVIGDLLSGEKIVIDFNHEKLSIDLRHKHKKYDITIPVDNVLLGGIDKKDIAYHIEGEYIAIQISNADTNQTMICVFNYTANVPYINKVNLKLCNYSKHILLEWYVPRFSNNVTHADFSGLIDMFKKGKL